MFKLSRSSGKTRCKVLVNSIPKSGTHLLERVIERLPGMKKGEGFLRTDNANEARFILKGNIESGYGSVAVSLKGHQRYYQEIEQILMDYGYKCVLIIRDPRDIVVSHMHWVTREGHKSQMNREYYRQLSNDDERLLVSIAGRPRGHNQNFAAGRELWLVNYHLQYNHIGRRIAAYLPWLRSRLVYVTRFENLVGSSGGGSDELQAIEIQNIARHLGMALTEKDIASIASELFTKDAKTFRKGQIGDWEKSFSWYHKTVFKSLAGQYLIDLGYEQGFVW